MQAKKADILIVQRNVLATAISALNAKRNNNNTSCLPKHGLIGNQAFSDINMLLRMFHKASKDRHFDLASLNNVSEVVGELQREMGIQPAGINHNKKLTTIRKHKQNEVRL